MVKCIFFKVLCEDNVPQKPNSTKWRSFRVPFSFLKSFPHHTWATHSNTKRGLGSGITTSKRLGLRFVAPVSAKARNMLSRRKSKISIPISNSTKMVVNETRISEAKVTIRELFEGITNWMAGFPESWSTPPGSAKRLLGWRLLFHAMFPTFTNLNAKTWTQRMRGRRPYEDDWNGKGVSLTNLYFAVPEHRSGSYKSV